SANLLAERQRAEAERETRREVEFQLAHADRLASVGKLTASLAHDIGTPLNSISGRAQMIMEDDLDAEEIRDYARRIFEQVGRVVEMIRQLLNFARRGEPEKECGDLNKVIKDAVMLLEPLARKARVKIESNLLGQGLQAFFNPGQIDQVVLNLTQNAVQAMQDTGGTVHISTFLDAQKRPLIEITDNGPGISPEIQKRMFEPFFTTKAKNEGTGLGLSVCQTIVRDHGGQITVTSQPGAGTTFRVCFPTIEKTQPSSSTQASLRAV
ncbi:MAG: ATP-binding protein, partial [Myxococcota bacterium]